jgi:hypothetical protein
MLSAVSSLQAEGKDWKSKTAAVEKRVFWTATCDREQIVLLLTLAELSEEEEEEAEEDCSKSLTTTAAGESKTCRLESSMRLACPV